MLTVLLRLFTLQAQNVIPEVIWAMLGIYVMAILVCFTSIWKTHASWAGRFFWILIVTGVPFLGCIVYCLSCLITADVTALKQFGFFSSKSVESKIG